MMNKVLASILVLVALISFLGCMTTSCRGKEKVSLNIPAAALVVPGPIFIKAFTELPAIIPATLTRDWGRWLFGRGK